MAVFRRMDRGWFRDEGVSVSHPDLFREKGEGGRHGNHVAAAFLVLRPGSAERGICHESRGISAPWHGKLLGLFWGTENALRELLDALELVGVEVITGHFGMEPADGGFLRFGGFPGRRWLNACEFSKYRGEGALAAVADVVIAWVGNLGFAEFSEDFHDEWKPRQGLGDGLHGLFARIQSRGAFRLSEHTTDRIARSRAGKSNDQIGILHPDPARKRVVSDGFGGNSGNSGIPSEIRGDGIRADTGLTSRPGDAETAPWHGGLMKR